MTPRTGLLLAALALSACAPPQADAPAAPANTVAPANFDAAAWLAEARPLAGVTPTDSLGNETPAYAAARALVARLPLDWQRACDTYLDVAGTIGEIVPAAVDVDLDAAPSLRGTFDVDHLPGGEAVVTVRCDFGAYQGTQVLVHVVGRQAALLHAPAPDADGQPGRPWPVFATPEFFPGTREFETVAKARGVGDCGTAARYRIVGLGRAEALEIRHRECPEGDAEARFADAWPVVWPRP